jgi:hypothetical protein
MLTDPTFEVDHAVQDRLQALADFLAKQKVRVNDRAPPAIDTREAHRVYVLLLRAATPGRRPTRSSGRISRSPGACRPTTKATMRA